MMGRPPKHPAVRCGNHRRQELAPVRRSQQRAPTIPQPERDALSESAKAYWRARWRSAAAGAWDREADLAPLTVYILDFDTWLRFRAVVQQAPLVRGSKEQLRPNPLIKEMRLLERQLRATEEQFGMSPRARISLGISLVEGVSKLEELRRDGERSHVAAGDWFDFDGKRVDFTTSP
jgi:P27 family predicted phage terminase small subunit